jgi:hypothetical protein
MAIAVVTDHPGMTKAQYEAVHRAVELHGPMPPGGVLHAAGPNGTGWRVIEVWSSREAFEQWLEGTVLPLIWRFGGAQPQIEVTELARLTGPDGEQASAPARAP